MKLISVMCNFIKLESFQLFVPFCVFLQHVKVDDTPAIFVYKDNSHFFFQGEFQTYTSNTLITNNCYVMLFNFMICPNCQCCINSE